MKLVEPDYWLEQMGEREWRFVESWEIEAATEKFNDILEQGGGKRGLTPALRGFLNEHPSHIDALHHYAMCKREEAKPLDALAFAHTAVATGRSALPEGFRLADGCLPGGWIENRPFLRALHGLMIAQREMHQTAAAIATGRELIGCDSQDRMGARLVLPLFLLELHRDQEALDLFGQPDFEDTFGTTSYLHALALVRLDRADEVPPVLKSCLQYYPGVADYLLQPLCAPPENDSPFGGMVVGSAYEAWDAAVQQRWVWERTPGALDLLRSARQAFARSHRSTGKP